MILVSPYVRTLEVLDVTVSEDQNNLTVTCTSNVIDLSNYWYEWEIEKYSDGIGYPDTTYFDTTTDTIYLDKEKFLKPNKSNDDGMRQIGCYAIEIPSDSKDENDFRGYADILIS